MTILLAKFRVKENPCLTSAPYQGAPNASKIVVRDKEYKTNDYTTPTVSRCQRCQGVKVSKTWVQHP